MGSKSRMKKKSKKMKNSLTKHQEESRTDFKTMDRSTESIEGLLKRKGKEEDAMEDFRREGDMTAIYDGMNEGEYIAFKKLCRQVEDILWEAKSEFNSINYNLFRCADFWFELPTFPVYVEEPIEEAWFIHTLEVAYTRTSQVMDLLKEISDRVGVQPRILTEEQIRCW
jgi:hypothetical protein